MPLPEVATFLALPALVCTGVPPIMANATSALVINMLPNLYSRVCVAYNILRLNGVKIGKRDYLGKIWPQSPGPCQVFKS